jgi:hypothetical protein
MDAQKIQNVLAWFIPSGENYGTGRTVVNYGVYMLWAFRRNDYYLVANLKLRYAHIQSSCGVYLPL